MGKSQLFVRVLTPAPFRSDKLRFYLKKRLAFFSRRFCLRVAERGSGVAGPGHRLFDMAPVCPPPSQPSPEATYGEMKSQSLLGLERVATKTVVVESNLGIWKD